MTFLTTQSTKIEVAAASMAELVKFYNDQLGKSIKKFETRAIGVARCTGLLKKEPATPEAPKPRISTNLITGETKTVRPTNGISAMDQIAKTVAKKTPAVRSKKTPAVRSKKTPVAAKPQVAVKPGRGRALFTEDWVITLIHKGDNPKRGSAAERFDLYRTGMTVAAYMAASGQRRDVVWDRAQGWIKVSAPK